MRNSIWAGLMAGTLLVAMPLAAHDNAASEVTAPVVETAVETIAAAPVQDYYADGQAALGALLGAPTYQGTAKNLIVFIGDGMGISTMTAARIYAGEQAGVDGESHIMAMDRLPHSALVKTYSHDYQVADSAATATAIVTGSKTRSGVLNIAPDIARNDCEASKGAHLPNLFEIGADAGKAIGVISTARITHATPASVYAHSPNRDWENDSELPTGVTCSDIAAQLIAWDHSGGLDVIMGGGRQNFLPESLADPEYPTTNGKRKDGRNLVREWQAKHPGGQYVTDAGGFAALNPDGAGPVLGLFEPSHMQFEADRVAAEPTEPALAEMVSLAIAKLARNDGGYILMVEGGRIDHAHHGGNARRALEDSVAFDDAIAKALEMVDLDETLVMVTADHSHVFTIAGYPPRGNPILGLGSIDEDGQAILAGDGKAYTTLGYANGPGGVSGERPDPAATDTQALNYRQQALVPLGSETHAGEDVALKADGPQAHLIRGTIEQNTIFHIARHILGL